MVNCRQCGAEIPAKRIASRFCCEGCWQAYCDTYNQYPIPLEEQEPYEQTCGKTLCTYKPKTGYIYIVHCVGFPYYKIGRSVVPKGRTSEMQTSVPFELVLEYAVPVKDMNEVEYSIHQLLKKKWIRGEWYLLTDDELNTTKSTITSIKDYIRERVPV